MSRALSVPRSDDSPHHSVFSNEVFHTPPIRRSKPGNWRASFVRNSRNAACGSSAMSLNFDRRVDRSTGVKSPLGVWMVNFCTRVWGSCNRRSASPSESRISSAEGCRVSPRNSRSKSRCESSSVTGIPWRASRNAKTASFSPATESFCRTRPSCEKAQWLQPLGFQDAVRS